MFVVYLCYLLFARVWVCSSLVPNAAFFILNDTVISANELNQDLKVINQWAYQWKMEFNPDPNKQAI